MQKWHIIAINDLGISVFGPFDDETKATAWGLANCDDDPRWNVVHLAPVTELVDFGMAMEEAFNTPALLVRVTAP